MKKTSKANFNKFKREFLWWMDKLDLNGYEVYFEHQPIKGSYATITINESGKVATVTYSSLMEKIDYDSDDPERSAKHEAIHLLIHRLQFLGRERFVGSEEMEHETERITRVLEKIL